LSSLINLFDYHQRVPTQIDWFILLKSVLLGGLLQKRRPFYRESISCQTLFSIFFFGLLRHRFGCEPLLRQRGRIIEIRFTLASVF
ncbi:hypothetical protein ACPFMY_003282, partial [Vibrio cholerae]